mgnify:CR=1 FL=1
MTIDFEDLLGGNVTTAPLQPLADWPETASTAAMATLLGVSTRTLSDLAAKGVLTRTGRGRWMARESVTSYIAHLRETAAGRDESGGLTEQRTRLAREQADGHALKNAVARGEMVAVADVRREWLTIATDLRSTLMAIPGRVSARMGLPRESAAMLESEMRAALEELPNES